MTALYPIWLFFAAFFFYFAYMHWRQSTEDIREFKIRDRESGGSEPPQVDLKEANQTFVEEFNRYLASVNKHNRLRHRSAAIGYAISGVVALISMGMLLFSN